MAEAKMGSFPEEMESLSIVFLTQRERGREREKWSFWNFSEEPMVW